VTEQDLIGRVRDSDEAAWATLVAEHQQAAFRLAYLLLGDADEAEDIAQEAFVRAFRALHRFDADRPFRPWLLQIVANLARNRQRSVRRYLAALTRAAWIVPESISALGERTAQTWEAQTLWQAVRRLSHADQQIIYLRYFLELGEQETAATLGIAPGTVKSRLHRAVSRLRAIVERDFPALREERHV
jgi:RNA polymerase sigma-70 factor, ECF subfamily